VKVRFTDTARRDLIRLTTLSAFGHRETAQQFRQDLVAQIFKLARLGVTGTTRPYLPEDVRAFPYRGRCFYLKVEPDALVVVRILHGRENVFDADFDV